MNKVEVTILGQSYLLACPPGGESALMIAVARVDQEMSAIRDAGKIKARERIAVLAALNLAYALTQREPITPNGPPAASASSAAARPTPAKATGADADADANDADTAEDEAVDPESAARLDDLIARIDQTLEN
jgi:cell division protein ZapA